MKLIYTYDYVIKEFSRNYLKNEFNLELDNKELDNIVKKIKKQCTKYEILENYFDCEYYQNYYTEEEIKKMIKKIIKKRKEKTIKKYTKLIRRKELERFIKDKEKFKYFFFMESDNLNLDSFFINKITTINKKVFILTLAKLINNILEEIEEGTIIVLEYEKQTNKEFIEFCFYEEEELTVFNFDDILS